MQTVLEPSRSLSVFRQIGSHEIERRSRQGSVQSSERPLRGSQFRGGTIQRSEFRGWLWRRAIHTLVSTLSRRGAEPPHGTGAVRERVGRARVAREAHPTPRSDSKGRVRAPTRVRLGRGEAGNVSLLTRSDRGRGRCCQLGDEGHSREAGAVPHNKR